MTEQKLMDAAAEIKENIKIALLRNHITQVEVAKKIGENEPQVSRAINGDMSPKSVAIRQKIYEVLGI